MYIDFDNKPAPVKGLKISTVDGSDRIDVDMDFARNPTISSDESNKIFVDVSLTDVSKLTKTVSDIPNIVKSVEYLQTAYDTARLIINTTEKSVIQTEKSKNGGFSLILNRLADFNMSYENNGVPVLKISSEKIGLNFFNYKYNVDGQSLIFNTPLSILNIHSGKIFINDGTISYIDINPNNSNAGTSFTVNGQTQCKYEVNSITNNSEIIIKSFPVDASDYYSIIPGITDKLVIIDPGHGGSETGAVSNGCYEKDINLNISLKVYTLLKNAGINVQLTRQDDTNMDLYTRSNISNQQRASLFVSIHNNSGDSNENGTMTLFCPADYSLAYGISSERVAQITQEELVKALGTKDLGIWKRPGLGVLNASEMPSIIAEVAYLSNKYDRTNLLDEEFRQKAAEAIYKSVIRSLNEMAIAQSNPNLHQEDVSDNNIGRQINGGNNIGSSNNGNNNIGSQTNPEDLLPGNINGFVVPPKASAKCNYSGNSVAIPSMYDLTIQLDYEKERANICTLDEQRSEANQILSTKLDSETVNKIMDNLSQFTGYGSFIWAGDNDEFSDSHYDVWVKCLRYSGKATVQLIHK